MDKTAIPKEATLIEVKSFDLDEIQIVKKSLGAIPEGHVLIKVHAAPLNHLDRLKILGKVVGTKLPFTPGLECSGTVIDAKGTATASIVGKKVSAISADGCFRDHVIVPMANLFIHDEHTNLDDVACGFLNPLTAYGIVETLESLVLRL